VLLLAAVFGVLSALLMFAFLNSKGGDDGVQEALDSGAGAETVVVLTKNVNVGDKITSDMLGTKTIPAAGIVEGYFKDSDMSTLVGKVATAPMYSGEQVLAAKVTTYEGQDTATWKVPEGMRGLSLQVPHEAWIAAGLPQPGDRVDVLGITTLMKVDPLTGEEKPDVIAGFVAQDVLVLAIAQSVVRTVPKIDADAKTSGDGSSTGTGIEQSQAVSPDQEATTYEKSMSVTLALPPDLAAKVALLDAMEDDTGQYRLLVRQKGDTAPVQGKQIYSYEDVFPAR
jgi:Flp pilus assembly protein CpaB